MPTAPTLLRPRSRAFCTCTNQALVALMCNIFMTIYVREGMKELAQHNLAKAHYAAEQFKKSGAKLAFDAPFFNEFVIQTNGDPHVVNDRLLQQKIVGGFPLKKFYPELGNASLWCCTETMTKASRSTRLRRRWRNGNQR